MIYINKEIITNYWTLIPFLEAEVIKPRKTENKIRRVL